MSDPVYLNEGLSFRPETSAEPDIGAQYTPMEQAGAAANVALDTMGGTYARDLIAAPFSPKISGDEANTRFPDVTPKWEPDEQVSLYAGQQAQLIAQDKKRYADIMSARPNDFATWGTSAGTELLGNVGDPLNLVGLAIPESLIGRAGYLAARISGTAEAAARTAQISEALSNTIVGRMANAGVNNAAAVGLMEPIIQVGEQQEHQDSSWGQAASGVLFGGLLGAGLHGLGEVGGATWRSMMRTGVSSLDTGADAAGMNTDILAADRSQVVKDLTEQNGVEPTEDAVIAEVAARQQQFVDNVRTGKYFKSAPALENTESDLAMPDEASDLAANGQFAEAAEKMKAHVAALEADPSLKLGDDEKEEINQPVSDFEQIKSAVADFVGCVGEQSGEPF